MKTTFPDPDDILNFQLTIEPDEGMYKGGSFVFNFAINQNFPHDPPKVKCTQKIYHPNIDLEGNVCLNILREDWKPVLNLNAVIVGMQVRKINISPYSITNETFKSRATQYNAMLAGLDGMDQTDADTEVFLASLQFLFLEPNASDPLNKEAAEDLRNNREGFRRNARTAMGGGAVKGLSYDRVLR